MHTGGGGLLDKGSTFLLALPCCLSVAEPQADCQMSISHLL